MGRIVVMRLSHVACMCLMVIAAAGCTTTPQGPGVTTDDETAKCERLYVALDAAVDRAAVRDGSAAAIQGYPYLRVNRFLASYQNEPMTGAQEAQWLGLLRDLDTQARVVEVANLPNEERARIAFAQTGTADLVAGLQRCGELLLRTELSDVASLRALHDVIEVPDEYQDWKRVLGLYPLSALPFLQGVVDYQSGRRAVFATPLKDLPVEGTLTRYQPPAASIEDTQALASIFAHARRNPLQIPSPSPEALTRLFATFAPVLEIDQVDRSDQIGMPLLNQAGEPDVDVSEPVVFLRTAHTRLGDKVHLQLVYSFWFPERPALHAFDLLAGRLDGITWRVTLNEHGEPLLYDSIHHCGCYHLFITTDKLALRESDRSFVEPVFVPARLSAWRPGERAVLRIAARTHYLQNVRYQEFGEDPLARTYTYGSDDQLRSLPGIDGQRYSLFRPDGIVPGTQRGERFVFWPMGVADPGAMRQWGRHATAFVGKRHFDDPRLIERYFKSK